MKRTQDKTLEERVAALEVEVQRLQGLCAESEPIPVTIQMDGQDVAHLMIRT